MNKRNIRHRIDPEIADDNIESFDIGGPVGMMLAVEQFSPQWPRGKRVRKGPDDMDLYAWATCFVSDWSL